MNVKHPLAMARWMSIDDVRSRSEDADVSTDTSGASAALGELHSTLLVLGTTGERGPHYMVGNWGTQASFDPWRFVMLLKKSAHTLGYAEKHHAFTVNLLAKDQKPLVLQIMKAKGEGHAGEKGGVDAPRMPEAYAGFDCKVLETYDIGGDHMLVVADVVDGWKRGDGPAMTVQDAGLSYAG